MAAIIEKESTEEIQHPHNEVPTSKRFLWGLGGFADMMVMQGPGAMVPWIYVNALGLNAAVVSMACAVPRFLDFITDPLIGHLSDNTRTKWGRRKPWMLLGLLTTSILGTLLWHPPMSATAGEVPSGFFPLLLYCFGSRLFWYISLMMIILFSIGYAAFSITHSAMGYEMSTDYNERTHLFKWRIAACALSGFITPWLNPLAMALEKDPQHTRGSQGIVYVSIFIGITILLAGLPSILFCKEKVSEHKHEKKVPFLDAVKMTLRVGPFWLLVASNFIMKFLMCLTGMFFCYVFIYHVASGKQELGAALLGFFFLFINVFSLSAMAPIAKLTERMGKKPSLLLMLSMSAVAYGTCWFTLGNSPAAFVHIPLPWGAADNSLTVQWPCIITALLIGVFTNTIPMIQNSMIADICDLDELKTGHRREAFFGAVFVTTDKLAIAVALAFQGFLLVYSGFNSKLETQAPQTINFWLLALIITQPVGCFVGLLAVFFYPLTRKRCHEIREELAARQKAQLPT